MLEASFLEYLSHKKKPTHSDKLLLAVSGGIDSMVMADLFLKNGFTCSIAHCNFNLRDTESDQEQEFVKEYSDINKICFHTKSFDTKSYAKSNKLSVEMAARNLRYEWFNELLFKHDYKYIAVAHNKNDVAETILINLTRGTGLRGLTGIKFKNGNIIRPLLFAERNDIEAYASKNNIAYKTDSSNLENDYTRNKFRNIIIPELKKINPSIINTLYETSLRLKDNFEIYENSINKNILNIVIHDKNKTIIDIKKLKKTKLIENYLFEILSHFSFNNKQLKDIYNSLNAQSGKHFFSSTHSLVKDRDELIISEIHDKIEIKTTIISNSFSKIEEPIFLEQTVLIYEKNINLKTKPNIAIIDFDKINYPLEIRKWKEGDYFTPFGMTGKKKVSDYLINNKISLYEKENTYVLCSNNEIVWLIGNRISNKVKVDNNTKKILILTTKEKTD